MNLQAPCLYRLRDAIPAVPWQHQTTTQRSERLQMRYFRQPFVQEEPVRHWLPAPSPFLVALRSAQPPKPLGQSIVFDQ